MAVTAAVLAGTLPAAASAACPTTATSKPFSRWDDSAEYSIAPGGSFESPLSGWTTTGAARVAGNETYRVRSVLDDQALAIASTGLVVTAPICVSAAHPSFRFFARRTTGTWGFATIKLRWVDATGITRDTVVGSVTPTTLWAPTSSLPLATALPLTQSGSSLNVQIVIDPEDSGGGFALDDLYVDPYRK